MRYLVAAVVSCLLFGALFAYHRWVVASVSFAYAEARVRAGLPPNAPLNNVGVPLPGYLMTLITLDDLIIKCLVGIVPLVLAICFGAAALTPQKRATPNPTDLKTAP